MASEKRPEAMRLTTTLNLLRKCRACKERYAHLVAALGGVKADHDAPINLLGILRINGIKDCEWVLSEGATVEDCAPLWAEYERQSAPLWAEYERQSAPLRAEYGRQCDTLWDEYLRQSASLLAALLEEADGK